MNKLSYRELVTIGIGMIIGSGVITLTGYGIGKTDTGIFFAYIVAGIAFLTCMLPTLIVGISIPRTSFSYTVSKELLSPIAGGMFLMTFFIGRIIMAFFGVSFASYLASILPAASSEPIKKLVAVAVVTLFYIVNLFGVKSAAKVQKFFNIVLIVALVSFALLGIIKLQPDALTTQRLFAFGFKGFLSAVVLVMFPMGGGLSLLEFGGQVEKPEKNLFYAILTVSGVAILLFASVGLAGAGVLPYSEVANKPLTNASLTIYGSQAASVLFVVGGALMAIVTTINSSYMWYCNTMLKGVQDGWFPTGLAKTNKHDVPYLMLTIFYIIGVVPILLGADISFLATVATGLALLFYLIPNFALIGLPKKYPEEWKRSRFYIKSNGATTALTLLCSGGFIALIIYNFLTYPLPVLLVILGTLLLLFAYVLLRYKHLVKEGKMGIKGGK